MFNNMSLSLDILYPFSTSAVLPPAAYSLLLVLFDEAFGFAVFALQCLVLRLGLFKMLVHCLTQALGFHPVALELLHAFLRLSHGLFQLGLFHPPTQLFLLGVSQLQKRNECKDSVSSEIPFIIC